LCIFKPHCFTYPSFPASPRPAGFLVLAAACPCSGATASENRKATLAEFPRYRRDGWANDDHVSRAEWIPRKYIIEDTRTGIAIFDYDNDGGPHIFPREWQQTLEGSSPPISLPQTICITTPTMELFTDVTEKAGRRDGMGTGSLTSETITATDGNSCSSPTYGRTVCTIRNHGVFHEVPRMRG